MSLQLQSQIAGAFGAVILQMENTIALRTGQLRDLADEANEDAQARIAAYLDGTTGADLEAADGGIEPVNAGNSSTYISIQLQADIQKYAIVISMATNSLKSIGDAEKEIPRNF